MTAEADLAVRSHPSGDDRFALIDKHLKRVHYGQDQLIETLHIAQDVFGYLSEDVLMYVARALMLPPSMVEMSSARSISLVRNSPWTRPSRSTVILSLMA